MTHFFQVEDLQTLLFIQSLALTLQSVLLLLQLDDLLPQSILLLLQVLNRSLVAHLSGLQSADLT